MSEYSAVDRSDAPRTRTSLAADLGKLGLAPGMTVIVHSAMSSLGWVCGGPVAVVQALMDVLTPAGTLVMPAHSGEYSDPANWQRPPVPESWWPAIRAEMPLFDPRVTPTRGMGRIAECFRSFPDVRRSAHPQVSFSAWGRHADLITEGHRPACCLGETSPLARLYELDAHVLLLGVDHGNNTSMHLAEYRAPGGKPVRNGMPWVVDGVKTWAEFDDIETDSDPFAEIGADFDRLGGSVLGRVGSAECRLMKQRAVVDFTAAWLTRRRGA